MVRLWYSPPEIDGEEFGVAWKKLTLTWGYFWGGCLTSLLIVFNLFQGRYELAALEVVYTSILFVSAIVMMRTGRGFRFFAWAGMLGMMIFPNLNSLLAGGFFGSGGRGIWAFTAPMMSALLLPDACTLIFFLVYMFLLTLSLWYTGPFEPYSNDVLPFLYQFHMIGLFFTTFVVFLVFFRKMIWQNKVLHRQEVERKEVAVKSQILSTMSHEIRTPLNAIIGLLDIVSSEPLPAQASEHVSIIQHASRNLLSLVTDVLDYSKIVEGRFEMERIPVDVADTLRNAVAAHQLAAQMNGTSFDLGFDPARPMWVEGDPTRLAQIANNLISNAVKFSPQGRVSVEAMCTVQGVVIAIRDTGVGIAPEHMDKLFQPFSQAETSISRRFGGTGLGLAIVNGIVTLSGGRIEVQSDSQHGSEFVVHLPWKSVPAPGTPPQEAKLIPWNILVVDDNAVNLKVAARLLEKLGMEAHCAGDGEAALDWLATNPCDLVLMDLQMPVLDGYQTSDRIREKVGRDLPIVALSAEVLDTNLEKLREHGMKGFLGKPINLERLRNCLQELQRTDSHGHMHVVGFAQASGERA